MANTVIGLERTLKAIKSLENKYGGKSEVVVGFAMPYAVVVHENLEAHHNVGNAKYLEKPARQYRPAINAIIKNDLKAGRTLVQATLKAGRFLIKRAQEETPVDTSALQNSGYCCQAKDATVVAEKAYLKGEAIRQAAKGKK